MSNTTGNQLIKDDSKDKGAQKFVAKKTTKSKRNPSGSPAVEAFLEALEANDNSRIFPLLDAGEVFLVDDAFFQKMRAKDKKFNESIEAWQVAAKRTAEERDVYGQFFYDWVDLFAKTPILMQTIDEESTKLIEELEKAIADPTYSPSEAKISKRIIGKIMKALIFKPKNREIIGDHVSKMDFKGPSTQLLAGGKIPAEFEPFEQRFHKLYDLIMQYQNQLKYSKK